MIDARKGSADFFKGKKENFRLLSFRTDFACTNNCPFNNTKKYILDKIFLN